MKFMELEEHTRQEVIYKYFIPDWDWSTDDIRYWEEVLESIGFMDPNIEFTGFGSQGDGACFACKWIDNEKILTYLMYCGAPFEQIAKYMIILELNYNLADMLGIPEEEDIDFSFTVTRSGYSRYSHKGSCYTEVERAPEMFEELADEFKDWIDELREELCDKIYDALEIEYGWMTSEEYVNESCECNDHEFEEDGTMILN